MEELARVTTIAQHEWVLARQQNDFRRLQPWLEQIVRLKRDEAGCLAGGGDLYNALLSEYEPGLHTREIELLFGAVRESLALLIPTIVEAQRRHPELQRPPLLCGDFPEAKQRIVCRELADGTGF